MMRTILSSLVLAGAAITMAPASAAADDCRCTTSVLAVETPAEPDRLARIVCAEGAELDPEARLSSGASPEPLALPAPAPEPVPWCTGADDPRCMPGQGEPAGQNSLIPLAPTLSTSLPSFDDIRARPVSFEAGTDVPPMGVRTRVERPPRR